ncbi:MAG: MBL fold metallo-hydrolase [Phycisphaerae bacterium]|nr:MBL fold metallo-hydrolase [Phycisphaerae bacterium]NIR65777.1 MBL fold metallo-hydrolase [candidate division Zixibacteria bacterium]NIP51053.1 MBL fold metallo-hydrolase [Phycisphaerae bacterium]NIS52497.1 MBL fold metallo-hydrolase [Phycisphaerae bacterium]NIU10032.1 MBL fold metallo-hydrolase [Phycisphaerae bacterium]
MKIDHLILGAFETNCYVLRSAESAKDCLIIDTGLQADHLVGFLKQNNLNPVAVVLTHGHPDHAAGVAVLRESFPEIKVCIHKNDADMLTGKQSNFGFLIGPTSDNGPADLLLEEEGVIEHAGIKLHVLHTPGHTSGGICLYSEEEGIVFTDDTLFADSVGRTDLGGNMAQLIMSIREKLFTLPDDTKVYPGHGPESTIAHEKQYNQFLQ